MVVEEELELVEEGADDDTEAAEADGVGVGAEEKGDAASGQGSVGARLIALNMALNGTPRNETARYLEENFDLDDQDSILDEVYARVGS